MDRLHRSSRAHYKVKYNWGEKQTLQELQMQFAVTITAEHHFVSKRCVFYRLFQGDVNINLSQGGIHKLEDREVSWENMENINKMTQNTLFSGIYGDDWKNH